MKVKWNLLLIIFIFIFINYCAPIDQKVDNLIKQGKFEEANKLMEQVYPSHIQDAQYNYLYGKTFIYLKKFKKAEKFFKKAININPDIKTKIGNDLFQAGKEFAEKNDFEASNFLLASAIMKNKELKEQVANWAYQNWTQLQDKNTDKANFFFDLLKRYYGQEKLVKNLEEMEKEARYNKDWKKAFDLVNLIIDAAPAKMDTKPFYKRYILYMEKFENFDKVSSTYQEIKNLFPDDEEIAYHYMLYLIANNKTKEVPSLIDEAISTFKKSSKPFILRAIFNLKRNLGVIAKRDFKRAVRLKFKENDLLQNYLLAIYYSLLKNKKKAIEYVDKVLKQEPEYVFRIENNPLLTNIQNEPDFTNLINNTLNSLKA